VFLALGVGACLEAHRLGFGSVLAPQPGFFPWFGGLVLVGLSLGLFGQAWRGRDADLSPAGEWTRPAMLLAALVLYVPLLEPVGYPIATIALCTAALRVLESRWSVALGVSIGIALATFFLFKRVLGIELPVGALFFGG
jgi:putative tricarboxylic transport membrane protein